MFDKFEAVKQHLLFLIDLETKTLASFAANDDDNMVSHCRLIRNTYLEVLDYVYKIEQKHK